MPRPYIVVRRNRADTCTGTTRRPRLLFCPRRDTTLGKRLTQRRVVACAPMALYLVHCHLPDLTLAELTTLQHAAQATGERLSAGGQPVRLVRSTFVPSEAHLLCLFEADHARLVRDLTELAQLPFQRIVEALELGAAP